MDRKDYKKRKIDMNDKKTKLLSDNKVNYISTHEANQQFNFYSNKNLTIEECNLLLPETGYTIFDINTKDKSDCMFKQNLNCSTERESWFFAKISTLENELEKKVYENLFKLLKNEKSSHKKTLKFLKKYIKSKKLFDCTLLFFVTFELSDKIKKSIFEILCENAYLSEKEIFYICAFFINCQNLKELATESLKTVFDKGICNFVELINNEIRYENSQAKKFLGNIICCAFLHYGYGKVYKYLEISKDAPKYLLEIFLLSHFSLFRMVDKPIEDFIVLLIQCLQSIIFKSYKKIKILAYNIISLLARKQILSLTDHAFFYNSLYSEMINDYELFSENKHNYRKHLLNALAYLSKNNQSRSTQLFTILEKKEFVYEYFKVIKIISEDLNKDVIYNYTLVNFVKLMTVTNSKHRNQVIQFFLSILPSSAFENELVNYMIDKKSSDIVLEILVKCKHSVITDVYLLKDNLLLLIKNCNISALHKLSEIMGKIPEDDIFYHKLYEIGKMKINDSNVEKQIFGLQLLKKIVYQIDKQNLKKLGNSIFEKLEQNNEDIFILQMSILSTIIDFCQFGHFTQLILDLIPVLNNKNQYSKYAMIEFMSKLFKANMNIDHNISKIHFLRICYSTIEYTVFCYIHHKSSAIELLTQISTFISPQEIINIFLTFIEDQEIKIKKTVFMAFAEFSKNIGLFNVIPLLVTDYKFVKEKVKLRILRCLFYMNFDSVHLYLIIYILENSILKPDIKFRISGLKCINSILSKTRRNCVDVNFMIHILNLAWYNILEDNQEIKKEFDIFIQNFTFFIGANFLQKYVILGLNHPAKKVRKRYKEIYEIVKINGKKTFSYYSKEFYW